MKKSILCFVVFLTIPFLVTTQDLIGIDFISPFHNGLSAIQKDGQWAFIDTEGKLVIDYRADLVLDLVEPQSYPRFNSGRCLIVKKEDGISYFGFIDTSGKTVIEPQYLNASNFDDGLAVVLQLHKNRLGQNDILDKAMIDYSYTENAINPSGKVVHYLSEKPTHVTLSKYFLKAPPKIKTKFISKQLVAKQDQDDSWQIQKI